MVRVFCIFLKEKHQNNQFLTYLGNISSMNGLQYWFDGDKADLPTLKTNFQTIFQKTDANGDNIVFEKIWANANLRTSLFGNIQPVDLPAQKPLKLQIFQGWVTMIDNKIFNFIKIK